MLSFYEAVTMVGCMGLVSWLIGMYFVDDEGMIEIKLPSWIGRKPK
jgi:hypothetical protein